MPSTPDLKPEIIEAICTQTYELAEVIVSANYFVVDVLFEKEDGVWVLKLFLDHPNEQVRVTIEDCQDISQALSPMLDDNIQELEGFPYALEVSSPGMFRELSKPREFNFYANRRVEITVKDQPPFFAVLKGYNSANSCAEILVNDALEQLQLPLAEGTKITLSPDLTQEIETLTVPRRINRYD